MNNDICQCGYSVLLHEDGGRTVMRTDGPHPCSAGGFKRSGFFTDVVLPEGWEERQQQLARSKKKKRKAA